MKRLVMNLAPLLGRRRRRRFGAQNNTSVFTNFADDLFVLQWPWSIDQFKVAKQITSQNSEFCNARLKIH